MKESKQTKPLLVATGEPAGIGPDLCLLAAKKDGDKMVLIGDGDLLRERAKKLNLSIELSERTSQDAQSAPEKLRFLHQPVKRKVRAGKPHPANVPYLLSLHKKAVELCAHKQYAALVTAPTDKGLINQAGVRFTDLTTHLRMLSNTKRSLTMFIGDTAWGELRVSFVTMHIPFNRIRDSLTSELIKEKILMTHQALQRLFSLPQPHIGLSALNPHSGEQGVLGDEEKLLLNPIAEEMRGTKMKLTGPLSADSVFRSSMNYDAVIALYHDQGLAPFKALTFNRGAQLTYGLPFIRTSPDHGTAYSIAGSNRIDCGSMKKALRLAYQLSDL